MYKSMISSTLLAGILLSGPAVQAAPTKGDGQAGLASFYHDRFHGRRTASGAPYNKHSLSAAHRTLPLGTQVRVTHSHSGRSVVVSINDRGPYARGRLIDLSRAAASQLGMTGSGVARVKVEVLGRSQTPGT